MYLIVEWMFVEKVLRDKGGRTEKYTGMSYYVFSWTLKGDNQRPGEWH